MSVLLDLVLAGSRVAAWVGVLLVAVPSGVLAALAVRGVGGWFRGRPGRPGRLVVSVEPVTELLPRCVDELDATVVIPRQRAAVGGGRRG